MAVTLWQRLLSPAKWFKRHESVWTDVLSWGGLGGGGVALSGVNVSPDSALSLTAAYAAINVIATDVAMLPLKVYKARKSGGRDRVTDDPRAWLLGDSPDRISTSMRVRQHLMGHVLGWGNGYQEITFDGDGMPTGLYLVDPKTIAPKQRSNGAIVYEQAGKATLPAYRVCHFAGLGFDGLCGYSPITKAREAIGLGLAAEQFGAAFFGNGSTPKGVLKTPGTISEDAAKRLRTSWENLHRGPENANRIAILEQGLEWQNITIPPEDAQFLATRKFQVEEIARIYRLAPHKLSDLSQAHLANIEASNLDHLTTTLAPWCQSIEQEYTRKLFTTDERRAGWYVEHDMRALMRGDMRARAEYYTRLRDLGVYSPNDIRDYEDLNPLGPVGDIRLVPLNMVSLEAAGKQPEEPQPAAQAEEVNDEQAS